MSRPVAGLLAAQAAFQAGLAAGAPWGPWAYGGAHDGVVPTRLRVVSAVAATAYAGAAVAAARLEGDARRRTLNGVAAVATLGAVPNALSPSPAERALWTPWCVLTGLLAWRARDR